MIGQTIDTNSAWLGQELDARGYEVRQISSISDQPTAVVKSIDQALERAELLILTGGLGPTSDDRTKDTLVEYFGMELVENEEVLLSIHQLLKGRGVPLSKMNLNQAMVPDGCIVLKNDVGTAPGMLFRKGSAIIVSMPGVPFEMKSIASKQLFPWLEDNCKTDRRVFRMVMTTGYPESVLANKLADWEKSLTPDFSLAYLPSPGIVKLRISVSGFTEDEMSRKLEEKVAELVDLIPDAIYSTENESIEETVGRLLIKTNSTVGAAESCTGGSIAKMITGVPGSSAYFSGSYVCYSYELKEKLLNIDHQILIENGAVSEKVVSLMAISAREKLETDYAIATSGIAGPGGGTADKPVGLVWISVASGKQVISKKFNFGDHRGRNITRSSIAALNMLRLLVIEEFHNSNVF